MRLRLLIFNLLLMVGCCPLWAEQTAHEQRVANAQAKWARLIPNIGCLQYAGDIGLVSAGFGWDYGKNDRWETTIHAGFVPKYNADNWDLTFTLRENFIPWSIGLGPRRWADKTGKSTSGEKLDWNRRAFASFDPFYCSFFVNTIFDDEFWVHEPNKYNGGDYYRFSSKVRFHFGIGSRFSLNIPQAQRRRFDKISVYGLLSTYDLAVISAIPNEKITLSDILCLGIGVQYKFF